MANIKDFVVKQGIVAEGTAPSVSTATGTLIVGGGAGIGGNVNIGGYIKRLGDVTNDTHSLGAQLSFRDAIFTDSLITGRTAWGIVNYFGNPQLDTISENATYTNATNIFIKGPPQAVAGGNLTIEKSWALYASSGSFYIGEASGSTSTAAGQALQIEGGISFGNGIYGSGGGSLFGYFEIDGSQVLTKATQNVGLVEFPDGILVSTSTNSFNTGSGALVLSNNGGAGIGGNVYIGGYLAVLTTATILGTENAVSTSTGALRLEGGLGVGQDLFAQNGIFVSGLSSTSTVGGNSVQITNGGGLGVSGSAFIQGLVYLENTTDSNAVDTGALVVRGGVGIEKNLTVDTVAVVSTNLATDETTGALTVTGGVGIAGNLIIGATDSSTGTTASNALVVAGGGYFGGDLSVKGTAVIEGDLLLLGVGTQVTINSTNTYIVDPVIEIGGGPNGEMLTVPDIYDKGLLIHYQNAVDALTDLRAFIGFENSTERYIFKQNIEPGVGGEDPYGDFYNSGTWSTLEAGTLILRNDLDVTGTAAIDGDATFASTVTLTSAAFTLTQILDNALQVPNGGIGTKYLYIEQSAWINNAEVLTTGTVNNNIGGLFTSTFQFANLTESNSTDTGAVTVAGGVGIGGNLNVGGNQVLGGTLTVNDETQSSDTSTGALVVVGGVGIGKNLNVGGTVSVTDATNSTGTNNGAVVVAGGVGIAQDLYVGGFVIATNTMTVYELVVTSDKDSTATDNGAVTIAGGLGVGKTINSDRINVQTASINSGTSSTSTDTGDLVVAGGAGVGENLHVGNNLQVYSTDTASTTATGAVIVEGGVGIGRDIYIGGKITRNGEISTTQLNLSGAALAISSSTYIDELSGGSPSSLAIASLGRATVVGTLNPTWGDASTLYIDNAPQFTGGADANRKWALFVNQGSVKIAAGTVNNNSTNSGALQVVGGVGVGGNLTVGEKVKATTVEVGSNLISSPGITNKSDSTAVTIDTYVGNEFTTAKYLVQVNDLGTPNKFHVVELMVTYDGSAATSGVYISQYGIITNTGELGTFDVTYNVGDINVIFTPNYSPVSMSIRAVRFAIIT
jgi:hypothetical protein